MKRDPSRLRRELRRLEESRSVYLEEILKERGPLRRGAFITVQRRCGKPNCRCAEGDGHPAKYLSVKKEGRTRMVYVPAGQEVRIAREAERYRRLRKSRAMLAKLARQVLELIDELEQTLQATDEIAAGKGKRRRHGSKTRSRRR